MTFEFPLGFPLGLPDPPATDLGALGTGFAVDSAAATLGIDIGSVPDLSPQFSLVGGYRALGESLARRFETPRGSLWYAPDYGTDLRGRLNDTFTASSAAALANDIEAEAEKDQRVLTARATVAFNAQTSSLAVALVVTTAQGPFRLILSVTNLTVQLLQVQPITS